MSTRREVGNEPVLAGDGARIAIDFMLVVVHEHDAVGVGGDLLEGCVVGAGRNGDKEAQIARMHLGVEFLDEVEIGRSVVVGQALKVQREAVIGGKSAEKA